MPVFRPAVVFLCACLWSGAALAQDVAPDWITMVMELAGGLALFLFGMEQMAGALRDVAGDRMRLILARLTGNRVVALFTGALVTAVIQSSSVTTVMLVGFVSAGLLSLSQAVGVILGADIGTTITAQIVAFKVTQHALWLVAAGFVLAYAVRREDLRDYGHLLMGLGLIFFGMALMSEAMEPLRDYPPFIRLMHGIEHPLYGIALGAVFTALVQSSSAAIGVVIALALQGLVTLEAGIALLLGANIGTCVTAALAAIGRPREALRVALAHVLFKVAGVVLVAGFIAELAALVRDLSPAAPELSGLDRLAAETPRQIANAHTVFNVGLALLFLPLTGPFARLCEWLVPERPAVEALAVRPRHLDAALIATPALALDRVRLEIGHLGEHVQVMLQDMPGALLGGSQQSLRAIAAMDDRVDQLHGHIVDYLRQVSRQPLTDAQTRELTGLLGAANDLENIGDIIETDLVALGHNRISRAVTISPATQRVLRELHALVAESVATALEAVTGNDEAAARRVTAMKPRVDRQVFAAARHELARLTADEPRRLATYTLEVDIIEKLKRIYYFAKRLAKVVAPEKETEVLG